MLMNSFRFWQRGTYKGNEEGDSVMENKKLDKVVGKVINKSKRFNENIRAIEEKKESLQREKEELNDALIESQLNDEVAEQNSIKKRIREVSLSLEELEEEKEAYKRKKTKGILTNKEIDAIRTAILEERAVTKERDRQYQEEEESLTSQIKELEKQLSFVNRSRRSLDFQTRGAKEMEILSPILKEIDSRTSKLDRRDLDLYISGWVSGHDTEYLFEKRNLDIDFLPTQYSREGERDEVR